MTSITPNMENTNRRVGIFKNNWKPRGNPAAESIFGPKYPLFLAIL